jgi:transposase
MDRGAKPILSEKILQIIELSQQNLFRSEIASQVGVSESTIYKYQKKFDLV